MKPILLPDRPLQPGEIILPKHTLFQLTTAAALLGISTKAAFALAEDGSLPLGFNLAVRPEGLRFVVVTSESLSYYAQKPKARRPETAESIRAEVLALFPLAEDRITSARLQKIFKCSANHLTRLAEAHLVVTQPGRGGRGGSALVTRASCIEFLLKRRIA